MKISSMGFGFMRLPMKGRKLDEAKIYEMFKYCIDNSINYFDTAWFYHMGNSEKMLAKCIEKYDCREKISIATKLPSYMVDSRDKMDYYIENQLLRLGVDTIDYYLLHAIDLNVFLRLEELGVIEFMNDLKASGKIKKMGFSFHGKKSDIIPLIEKYNWDFIQLQYNILDIEVEEEIDYAASKNIEVFIMEPLRGGMLANEIPESVEKLYNSDNSFDTPAKWALSYVLNNSNVTCVLSAMSEIDHIKENVDLASSIEKNSLSSTQINLIRKVQVEYTSLLRVNCTSCAYCLPCPVKIDIPAALKSLNNKSMFGKRSAKTYHFLTIGMRPENNKINYARNCIECGKCEKVCPQNIDIINQLKNVSNELEGPFVRAKYSIVKFLTKNK